MAQKYAACWLYRVPSKQGDASYRFPPQMTPSHSAPSHVTPLTTDSLFVWSLGSFSTSFPLFLCSNMFLDFLLSEQRLFCNLNVSERESSWSLMLVQRGASRQQHHVVSCVAGNSLSHIQARKKKQISAESWSNTRPLIVSLCVIQ